LRFLFVPEVSTFSGFSHKRFCLLSFEGLAQYRTSTLNRRAASYGSVGRKKNENPQRWRTEKGPRNMKRLNALVRLTFWLAALLAMVVLS
jgi:hypothetical protein